jgi:hypothetical protein
MRGSSTITILHILEQEKARSTARVVRKLERIPPSRRLKFIPIRDERQMHTEHIVLDLCGGEYSVSIPATANI